MADDSNRIVRLLCRPNHLHKGSDPGIYHWLIGSPFLPPLTIVSILRCIHTTPSSTSPDLLKESNDLRTLIPKGFHLIGALASGDDTGARAAIDAARELRKLMYGEGMGKDQPLIGGVDSLDSGEVQFFVCESGNVNTGIERIASVIQEENPEKFVWENGCLLRCELPIKLPIYYPLKNPAG
jgi:Ufm1-specific protease 2